jgi:Family of unknown function (DUF6491)
MPATFQRAFSRSAIEVAIWRNAMIKSLMLATTLVATVSAAPAFARNDPTWPADQLGKETSIPFMDVRGSLYNFEADSDRGVYLQDRTRRWYYARVLGPCIGLSFAQRIGVDTRFGGNQLDRTGTLLVDRDSCRIDSLTTSNGPPPKAKKPKKS